MRRQIRIIAACLLAFTLKASADTGDAVSGKALGLPPIALGVPARIQLGKKLFFDLSLSADGKISCATCHKPENAFSDGLRVAVGVSRQSGTRNTPSLWNIAFQSHQFWDGRRESLESQALDPLVNHLEHGLRDIPALLNLVRGNPTYRLEFSNAFNLPSGRIEAQHVAAALAAFERTLISDDSDFDKYFYGRSADSMSKPAVRGLELFRGRAQCSGCHSIGPTEAFLTDNQFHSLGVGFKQLESKLAETAVRVANTPTKSFDELVFEDRDVSELGRFIVTKQPKDIGKFKTPSLRNVALTAPYMHDGSIATLEEAVATEIYYRSLEATRPLILTPAEAADLVEFLRALTSPNALRFDQGNRGAHR